MELYKIIEGKRVLIADVSKPNWDENDKSKRGYIANKPPILRKVLLSKALEVQPNGDRTCFHNFGDTRSFVDGDFSIDVYTNKTYQTKLYPQVERYEGAGQFRLNFGPEKFSRDLPSSVWIRVIGYCRDDNKGINKGE